MSVRSDLESIVCDSKWTQLFEDRLKRSYNYHNLAFWIALRDLRIRIEVGRVAVAGALEFFFGFCSGVAKAVPVAARAQRRSRACNKAHRLAVQAGDEVSSSSIQERMDQVLSTYFDTESSQSIALSFKAKERFKRCVSFSPPPARRLSNAGTHQLALAAA